MKTINLTHQQYIKAGVIIIATLLLGIFLFLMINNSENLVGEASRSTSVEQGTWLVLSLEKQRSSYQITKATTQNYNKEKYNKFKEILPSPELMGLDSEIIVKQTINRKTTTISESFASTTAEIAELFTEDKTELIEYNVQDKNFLQVKIPIDNKINPDKPLEIMLQTPNTKQQIIKTTDFKKWTKLLQQANPNLITGRAITAENSCDLIKAISTNPNIHSNNVNDLNRINLIFIGHNYENKKIFVDSLPYYLDLNGKGIETYTVNTNTDKTDDPLKTRGIFHFVPFNENKEKFNIWYVDEIQEPNKIKNNFEEHCACLDPQVTEKELFEECGLNNIKILSLCEDYCASYGETDGTVLELSTKYDKKYKFYETKDDKEVKELNPQKMQIISHEFGHLFGGLADEYVTSENKDKPHYPNCLPNKEIAKDIWQDIFPNLEFYYGCSYTMENVRMSEFSLMQWYLSGDSYDPISQFHLCYKIFQAYGDVNGEFCDAIFFKESQPPKEICNNNLDDDGNGKTDCQEKKCQELECNNFINENTFEHWEDGEMLYMTVDTAYCEDNKDNDYNGKTDCEDEECFSDLCMEVCNDGKDNNFNELIDCEDNECTDSLICEEICGDGIDNNKNQIINTDSLEYNKCLDKKEKFMEAYCSTMPLFDKACTEKGGIGDSCNNNGDCFWQPKAFEKDSCINSLCTAHPDIYAISPPPKTCNDQLDCDYPELCKEVAYAGMFEEPICQKIKESFNKCVECLDPDCKFTEVCN